MVKSDDEKWLYYGALAVSGTPRQKAWAERKLNKLLERERREETDARDTAWRNHTIATAKSFKKKEYSLEEKRRYYREKLRSGTPGQKKHARRRLKEL